MSGKVWAQPSSILSTDSDLPVRGGARQHGPREGVRLGVESGRPIMLRPTASSPGRRGCSDDPRELVLPRVFLHDQRARPCASPKTQTNMRCEFASPDLRPDARSHSLAAVFLSPPGLAFNQGCRRGEPRHDFRMISGAWGGVPGAAMPATR
jgi:hypothetical protein